MAEKKVWVKAPKGDNRYFVPEAKAKALKRKGFKDSSKPVEEKAKDDKELLKIALKENEELEAKVAELQNEVEELKAKLEPKGK